jgi:hypothetical protein
LRHPIGGGMGKERNLGSGGTPKPCAAPRPFRGLPHEASLYRVVLNVSDCALVVFGITNVAVEIVALPESARATQNPMALGGGITFPRLNDSKQGCLPHFDKNVDMVGHDDPAMETVSDAVVMPEALLNKGGNLRAIQDAFAQAGIEMHVEVRIVARGVGGCIRLGESKGRRNGVGEAKSDELEDAGEIAMGKLAGDVPALEALGAFLAGEGFGPCGFGDDLLFEMSWGHGVDLFRVRTVGWGL